MKRPDLDGEHSREWWRLMVLAMLRHPRMYAVRTHILLRGHPTVMTPDSAWRQWRGAVNAHARAEENLTSARAIWLQTLLDGFQERLHEATADGLDTSSKKVLAALGLPCRDCLAPVPANCSGHTVVNGRDGDVYQLYAICGKAAIDPTRPEGMPDLFTVTETAAP